MPPLSLLDELHRPGPLAQLFQKAAGDVRRELARLLRGRRSPALLHAISRTAHEHVAEGNGASPLVVLRQCEAGCDACCHAAHVDITPLESLVVVEHLQREKTDGELATIRTRLAANVARKLQLPPDQRNRARLRCGLLGDDGLCAVYAARPLVCAGVFSLSRDACQSGENIPLDRPAKAWTMGISGGLQRALVEAGLDGNLYELNSIVLTALDTPDAARRWLAGEDIFAPCLCTDAHSPPRLVATDCAIRIDPPHSPAIASAQHVVRAASDAGVQGER